MYRLSLFLLFILLLFRCSPKIASTSPKEEYTEDLSAYRPAIEMASPVVTDNTAMVEDKGPFVAPTNTINAEMSALMDSIVHYNKGKTYPTYTIQVYIGRSREEANLVREKVYRVMPDQQPVLSWRQPSWLVTVGEYIERVDAYKTFSELKQTFPGATLVPEWKSVE